MNKIITVAIITVLASMGVCYAYCLKTAQEEDFKGQNAIEIGVETIDRLEKISRDEPVKDWRQAVKDIDEAIRQKNGIIVKDFEGELKTIIKELK